MCEPHSYGVSPACPVGTAGRRIFYDDVQRQTNKNNDLALILQGLQKKIPDFTFLNPVIAVKTTLAQTQDVEKREKLRKSSTKYPRK